MRILLTSPRAPVTLDLARQFHKAGDEVFLCGSLRFGCGQFTRLKQRSFLVSGPRNRPSQYVDSINRIIRQFDIQLLIPTCEEAFFLAALRDQIECDVFIDSLESVHNIHNKWTFAQTAGNSAAQVPESFLIKSVSQLDEFRDRCHEFVFKPAYSRFASEVLIRPKPAQLDEIKVSIEQPWIAQKFVSGHEVSTYSVARQGRLLAHGAYQSLFRAGVGSGICFRSTFNPTISKFVNEFVRQSEHTGQIGFDFIVDEDQKVWVIEGNPRATSGLHLFSDDTRLVEAIKGHESALIEPNSVRDQMVGAAMLLFGLKDAIKKRKISDYFRALFASRDVLFRWSDPLPCWALPLTLGELAWIAIREKMTLQQATTFDIEWNGEPL